MSTIFYPSTIFSNMNQTNKISLILLTKNEESNIAKNFNWLPKVLTINELVVIDDNSTDDTIKEVKKLDCDTLSIKTFKRSLNNDFSAQRQFAVDSVSNDWILWLDADETPSDNLIRFLTDFDFSSSRDYAFERLDIFLGKELRYGETAGQYFVRLFNRNYGKFVHPVHEIWHGREVVPTDFQIIHFSHPQLYPFLQKLNFYSDLRSQELFDQKHQTNLFEIIFYPIAKFIHNYVFRLGFLDSTPGIIMALCMSFHSFLVRSKLWHLWQKTSS